jgi:hypothetical protein
VRPSEAFPVPSVLLYYCMIFSEEQAIIKRSEMGYFQLKSEDTARVFVIEMLHVCTILTRLCDNSDTRAIYEDDRYCSVLYCRRERAPFSTSTVQCSTVMYASQRPSLRGRYEYLQGKRKGHGRVHIMSIHTYIQGKHHIGGGYSTVKQCHRHPLRPKSRGP